MNVVERKWKSELKKAAHKYGMLHVLQPFAHKDGVEATADAFIAGAEFARKAYENKWYRMSYAVHWEDSLNEYLSTYITKIESDHLEIIKSDFRAGVIWFDVYGLNIIINSPS